MEIIEVSDIINGVIKLPDLPGVYSWYRKLIVDPSSNGYFINSIEDILKADTWPKTMNGLGRIGPYKTEMSAIPAKRTLSKSKEKIADKIGRNPNEMAQFANLLLSASVFQPPLYVGKAKSIRSRINNHLRNKSKFSQVVFPILPPEKMVLAYVITDGLPPETPELLEGILGAASLPRYAGRIG